MTAGYDQPLYLLPFDHRHSYGQEVFGFHEPLTAEQIAIVAASKQVIYDAYKLALKAGVPKERSAILVDEEFGAAILRDAHEQGYNFAYPVEKSGQHEFDFQDGDQFGKHIEQFDPTFVKVLVRFNPADDPALNKRQIERLKRVSDYCVEHDRWFMFELLVPAETKQLDKLGGDHAAYDLEVRPRLMITVIEQLQDAGIDPDIWKIEGLERREDCVAIADVARRNGRDHVGCIVLGRGEDEKKVIEWLEVAATVPAFIGFAVGRSTFLDPIVKYRAGELTADAASKKIADRYREWISVFQRARAAAMKE